MGREAAIEPLFLPTFPSSSWTGSEGYVKVAIVLGAAGLLLWTLTDPDFWRFHTLRQHTMIGQVFWFLVLGYGAVVLGSLIWRLGLWRRYRPMPSVEDGALPSVTVVIPAFNEGELVRSSILSAAGSRYPPNRLEILVIDDGSTDDTWRHIRAAVRKVRDRVRIKAMRQPRNMGKRQALHRGFQRARGEVYVTIDSDSMLEPDSLRNAVSPLVRDPAIGCVAGCVQVMNPRQNLITRFLKCYFSLSFKFVRAYQSEFRGVFCTPGALSVYHAEAVKKVADEWSEQRFLGKPCATGEDRAMTNLLLREGWLTAYQGNAVSWCRMPHTYGGMVNMFLRWARSNIRETIVLWRFMFTRFRGKYLQTFRLNMILVLLSLVMPTLLISHSAALLVMSDGFVLRYLGVMLLFAFTMAIVYYVNERDSDWVWLLVYSAFWVICLSWILPYAALTLRNTGWLTRATPEQEAELPPDSLGTGVGGLAANSPTSW
ncbi:MAG: glycosyltransferase family 2 protein [Phycisphaerales bacterium]|nr:glycosyltransferase family 2 protein [Phycisphaerales bacterium]